jgi:hypothetical protein
MASWYQSRSDRAARSGQQVLTPVARPRKERRICRDDEQTSGSLLNRCICLAQRQWNLRDHSLDGSNLKTFVGR